MRDRGDMGHPPQKRETRRPTFVCGILDQGSELGSWVESREVGPPIPPSWEMELLRDVTGGT